MDLTVNQAGFALRRFESYSLQISLGQDYGHPADVVPEAPAVSRTTSRLTTPDEQC